MFYIELVELIIQFSDLLIKAVTCHPLLTDYLEQVNKDNRSDTNSKNPIVVELYQSWSNKFEGQNQLLFNDIQMLGILFLEINWFMMSYYGSETSWGAKIFYEG